MKSKSITKGIHSDNLVVRHSNNRISCRVDLLIKKILFFLFIIPDMIWIVLVSINFYFTKIQSSFMISIIYILYHFYTSTSRKSLIKGLYIFIE